MNLQTSSTSFNSWGGDNGRVFGGHIFCFSRLFINEERILSYKIERIVEIIEGRLKSGHCLRTYCEPEQSLSVRVQLISCILLGFNRAGMLHVHRRQISRQLGRSTLAGTERRHRQPDG